MESPHNVYLGIAAGSGIPALVAYLASLFGFVYVALQAARTVDRELRIAIVAVLAAVTGHVVTDAFMTAEVTSTWLSWVLIGGTLGVVSIDRSHRGAPTRSNRKPSIRP